MIEHKGKDRALHPDQRVLDAPSDLSGFEIPQTSDLRSRHPIAVHREHERSVLSFEMLCSGDDRGCKIGAALDSQINPGVFLVEPVGLVDS